MSWRTVVISSRCKLDCRMGYLVVRGETVSRVFLDEIALLMIENTAVSLTVCLLAELVARKVRVVFCDEKRDPAAELTPYFGSHDCARKLRRQMAWTEADRGAVWAAIVVEKIRNQEMVLRRAGRTAAAEQLARYAAAVEFADATNREGHAAKVYFNALFGMDFRRRSSEDPVNAALNYGYGLLLSACNREVAANGYLSQLGIFHDNVFNRFNLGCDLMEPFRPLVDARVFEQPPAQFGVEEKHRMLALLHAPVRIAGREQTVLNAIGIYAKSVFDALNGCGAAGVRFPDL